MPKFRSHAAEIGKAVIERHRKRFYLDQTLDEDDEADVVVDEKLISLTDIFKCLHISTLTNEMANFKEQFTNDRHDQLKVFFRKLLTLNFWSFSWLEFMLSEKSI